MAVPQHGWTSLLWWSTTALADAPGKNVFMITVDYPPGGADPIRRHDGHGFIYVPDASIVIGVKGGHERTLLPGQAFYEGLKNVHAVGRNASDTEPAKYWLFLLKDKRKPPVIPVK